MQNIYFAMILAAILIFLLVGTSLFMQRKRGERSRTILAGMTLLSVFNYVGMLVGFYIDPECHMDSIMKIPFLLIGIFVMIIYFIYPIEVVSPGWITWKRLVKMYIPVAALWLLYCVTRWLGVEYTAYPTLGDMMADVGSFQVIFRIVLTLLMFLPVVLIYYVPYTRRYNNTNYQWMRGYILAITINMVAYLIVNIYDTYLACSIYILISISCSLYIAYQELFVRLIREPIGLHESEIAPEPESECKIQQIPNSKESDLFDRLEQYMNNTQAWKDPDLLAEKIVSVLYTNRKLLLKAIQQSGCSSYTSYVNGKRVAEFIQIINRQEAGNYQQVFFDVGFRSKSTALRNFKDITGMIPSEYFQKQAKNE